jgi:hypothetical protein
MRDPLGNHSAWACRITFIAQHMAYCSGILFTENKLLGGKLSCIQGKQYGAQHDESYSL